MLVPNAAGISTILPRERAWVWSVRFDPCATMNSVNVAIVVVVAIVGPVSRECYSKHRNLPTEEACSVLENQSA